jgi:hypothetical protein
MLKQLFISFLGTLLLSINSFAQDIQYAVIGANDVKMRSEPNTNAELIGKFQLGEVAKILEISEEAAYISGINDDISCNKFNWYKLQIGNKSGWVFGAFVFELIKQKNIFNPGTELSIGSVANFYARSSGADMCYGDNFLAIIPGEDIGNIKNVQLIKVNKTRVDDYRGMPALGFDMEIKQIIHAGNTIVLITGGSSPAGYEEIRILELLSDGNNGYMASEKYFNSTN